MIWLMENTRAAEINKLMTSLEHSARSAVEAAKPSAAKPAKRTALETRIAVEGPLLSKRSAILDYFGIAHTAYPDIIQQVSEATTDKIVLEINSPGGTVDGLYNTMDAIANSDAEIVAEVGNMAASAAYMLASQADRIVAENPLSLIGSVGVAAGYFVGGDYREISNTDSPNKRPDMETEAGVNVLRAELDDIFSVIVAKIAEGRKQDVADVTKNYGAGAVMTAKTALEVNMIDAIGANETAGKDPAKGVKTMNEEERKAAFEAGVKAERDRVVAHLTLAEASGAMEIAIEAVKSGDGITETVKAQHLAAEIKNRSIAARQEEAPAPLTTDEPKAADEREAASKSIAAENPGVVIEWRN